MGMFDNVHYECVCPVCHSKVDGFQSKSGPCQLETLTPNEVDNFYASCEKCGCWIEYTATELPHYTKFQRVVKGKHDSEHRREELDNYTKEVRIP